MKIAMLNEGWDPVIGGVINHIKELSVKLNEEYGHDITIHTRQIRHEGKVYKRNEEMEDGRINIIRHPPTTEFHNPLGRVGCIFTQISSVSKEDYDLIHTHVSSATIAAKLSSIITQTPLVCTIHGTAIPTGVGLSSNLSEELIKKRLERLVTLEFDYDAVISVNNSHISLLRENHESVTYVPNGVNLRRFNSGIQENRNKIIVYLGRLVPRKRVKDLVKAFLFVTENHPEARLLIGGEGPERNNLEQIAATIGIKENVDFLGRVPDAELPNLYGKARAFVLPSVWEGHPLTIMEAWAASTPVIAADTEGIAEFIDEGENGLLFTPKDPSSLSKNIGYMLSNELEAKTMGNAGYKLVKDDYSWKQCAERTNSIYNEVDIQY